MLKLYKREAERVRYWEAWDNQDKTVVVHWGVVGDAGDKRSVPTGNGESASHVITRESRQALADGYTEIDTDDHFTVVVQFKTEGWGDGGDLDKRHEVEDILNECLGWTGNGHCDGGDIGSGTINAYSFVIDPYLAKDAIVEALTEADLLEGAIIAFHKGDEDETVLWPENFEGKFSIL